MHEALFVSDLHLSAARPGCVELFLRFLRQRAAAAGSLYILGDLFDAWIGDDDDSPPNADIVTGLRALSEIGTQVYFMAGNRDFLVGEAFAAATRCERLEDPTTVDVLGTPTLLMHGDLLCTDDTAYQQFRPQVRSPAFVQAFLSKSIPERLAVADDYRAKSGEATSLKAKDIMDVNQEAVERYMREAGVARLIHGHTHRPARHEFRLDGRPVSRLVLAEWHQDQGEVLAISAGGVAREAVVAG